MPAIAGRASGHGAGGTKTAQAGTRGAAAMVYGDFEFCLAVVMAEPAGRWNRREPGE